MNEPRRFVEQTLRRLEKAWHAKHHISTCAAAWRICRDNNEPEPAWLRDARRSIQAYDGILKTRRGRLIREATTDRKYATHYARWDAVCELRDRREELSISGSIYAVAATWLRRNGDYKATVDTVKKSYQLVERIMKTERAAVFYQH